MTTDLAPAADEFKLRQLVDSWLTAICLKVVLKDVEALMSHYTSDILLYDLAPPLLRARLDHRQAERHLRQPDPDHAAGASLGLPKDPSHRQPRDSPLNE